MEGLFKFVFFVAILVFMFTIVGIFLLIIKILFLFMPEVSFMGIIFAPNLN